MSIEKYVGRRVEVIYLDRKGLLTKRTITVYSVRDGNAKVFDFSKQDFRTLRISGVLAIQLVSQHAS